MARVSFALYKLKRPVSQRDTVAFRQEAKYLDCEGIKKAIHIAIIELGFSKRFNDSPGKELFICSSFQFGEGNLNPFHIIKKKNARIYEDNELLEAITSLLLSNRISRVLADTSTKKIGEAFGCDETTEAAPKKISDFHLTKPTRNKNRISLLA